MPEKLKRILQNKNWRSWKKSDCRAVWAEKASLAQGAAARAGGDIIACDCTAGGEWGWHSRKGI